MKQEEANGDSSSKGRGDRGRYQHFGNRSGGGRSEGGRTGEKNKSHIQCYQCKGWGHYKNECPNGAGSGGSKELPSM